MYLHTHLRSRKAATCHGLTTVGAMPTQPPLSITEVHDVVLEAFAKARSTGRQDWRTMTLAVLKNRMLQLSKGRFDERALGATGFYEFVTAQLNTLVKVTGTRAELLVDLAEEPAAIEDAAPRRRLRSDLWNAVIDFTSGRTYYWNPTARRVEQGVGERPLPTISADDNKRWHEEFARAVAPDGALARWIEGAGGMKTLPFRFRGQWRSFLQRQVEQRLRNWFEQNKLPAPELYEAESPLRKWLLRSIEQMSDAELEEITLPVRVLARSRESGRHQ